MDQGQATAYAIIGLEDRGVNFMEPGTEVYEGMIVGEHNRENDLTVNITKAKHQTNVRSANKRSNSNNESSKNFNVRRSIRIY